MRVGRWCVSVTCLCAFVRQPLCELVPFCYKSLFVLPLRQCFDECLCACERQWDPSELLTSEECYVAVKCVLLFDFESGPIQAQSPLFSAYFSICRSIVLWLSLILSFFVCHLNIHLT